MGTLARNGFNLNNLTRRLQCFLSKINSFLFVPLTIRCLQMTSLNREKTALNDKCQAEIMLNLNITPSNFLATLTLKS